ncbi:MAG TPA: type II toxin-antitoxin system Phd/YefM family antitoxin [Acidimicrobiia bacterium]|nr:type II toxin-antitoxin system Phd/YefM family antitoxin [Acidimicrobiia bacterium]
MTARTVPAGEFKATCLKLLDDVAMTGVELIVTKRGKPVARVVPVESVDSLVERLRGEMLGSITYHCTEAEFLAPIDVEWDALQ